METSQNKVNYAKVEFLIDKPKMAQFLKFKFLIAFKLNYNGGSFLKLNIKIWLFQEVGKISL